MINNLNRSVFTGHLGADAKQTSANTPVTFSIAVSSHWTWYGPSSAERDRHNLPQNHECKEVADAAICKLLTAGINLW